MSCNQKDSIGGLSIEVLSGKSLNDPICKLGNRTDVQHIVNLENLKTYPVKVTCKGIINSNPNIVQFHSNPKNINDTDRTWDATVTLGNMGQKTFSHVNLHSLPGFGFESVDTQIDAHWFQMQPDDSIIITITVQV